MPNEDKFSNRLRGLRRKAGMTQESLAKALGISSLDEWDLDSIKKRDEEVAEAVMKILRQWNDEYQ